MIIRIPRSRADSAYANISSGVRCAEITRASNAIANSFSTSQACCIVSQSESDPIKTPITGWARVALIIRSGAGTPRRTPPGSSGNRISQASERLAIFAGGALDDFGRQRGRRRRFVPGLRLQPVAHELLVEARRRLARPILVLWPEARRIRRQHLVHQAQDPGRVQSELELRIGDQDAAALSVGKRLLIQRQGRRADLSGKLCAQHPACLLE